MSKFIENEPTVGSDEPSAISKLLLVLPLCGLLINRLTAIPLNIGQTRSSKLVDHFTWASRLIGPFSRGTPELSFPGAQEIGETGITATGRRNLLAGAGSICLLVAGPIFAAVRPFWQTAAHTRAHRCAHTGLPAETIFSRSSTCHKVKRE